MESHIVSWNNIIALLCGIVILYLLDSLLRYRRHYKKLRAQLLEREHDLQNASGQYLLAIATFTQLHSHSIGLLQDVLTGLPTLKVFEDRLDQTINQSERHQLIFAVMLLDIDDFKMMNNVLGVGIGDLLLKEVAQRLKNCIRKVDTVSRFGSDTFAFLLPQLTKPETAAYVAQRLLDDISRPFYVMGHELFVTASIGITSYPADGITVERLLKNADIALQQAKARGRDAFQFYHEDLYAASHRELRLNSCLRSDSIYDELTLYYQPIVDVKTHEIIAMEALLRWQHPELGLVPPQDFLRLAENNGRIVAIGEWVLRHACEQFQTWRERGWRLQRIAVNVSLRQLENTSFSYNISKILQEYSITPPELTLEISECALLPKLGLVEKTLHMLKHLGVQIAIDDFGTGYLSLQHLQRFPVTYLKIDNTLVQDMFLNRDSQAIVKTIIDLAASLQLATIAEGVENEKQKKQLCDYGCWSMQGYLFSHPRLPDEFSATVLQDIVQHA